MSLTINPSIISTIILGIVVIIIAMVIISNARKIQSPSRFKRAGRSTYVPGYFNKQMELDMRLPYRRFKQLYPNNQWTYEEYKRMQMKTAFRRSNSSQDNKRMVR